MAPLIVGGAWRCACAECSARPGAGSVVECGVVSDGAVGVLEFRRGSHLVEESEGLAFPVVLFHLENP